MPLGGQSAVLHTRLLDGDRPQSRGDGPLGQVAVANDLAMAVFIAAVLMSFNPARIKKWVPPYTPPGETDLFYINNILATLWREPDGSLPRHGNPQDPLDDLIYLMLTRRGQIRQAQQLFESLRRNLISQGHCKPDWSVFLDQGAEAMARCFTPLGMGQTRAREMHAALTLIKDRFGQLSLDLLRRWGNTRCIEFLCSLPGVSLKTATCVMLYTLGRQLFPSDVHYNRVLARLGVLPSEYSRQKNTRRRSVFFWMDAFPEKWRSGCM